MEHYCSRIKTISCSVFLSVTFYISFSCASFSIASSAFLGVIFHPSVFVFSFFFCKVDLSGFVYWTRKWHWVLWYLDCLDFLSFRLLRTCPNSCCFITICWKIWDRIECPAYSMYNLKNNGKDFVFSNFRIQKLSLSSWNSFIIWGKSHFTFDRTKPTKIVLVPLLSVGYIRSSTKLIN